MTGHQDMAFLGAAVLPERDTGWMEEALCAYYWDPEIWFPDSQHGSLKRERDMATAISICQDCPVRAECYADALERGERWGIWGGTDFYAPENKHRKAS